AAQSRDVALAKQRDLLPARLALGVIEFRRRLLFARLFVAAFLDALGEDDFGVGVAIFAFLDLALVVFNDDGEIVEAQPFRVQSTLHHRHGVAAFAFVG